MFETRDDLLNALLAVTYEQYELPVPDDQKHGILARIFGKDILENDEGETSFPPDVAHKIVAMARDGASLETDTEQSEATAPLGASKIGGSPDLPAGMAWPTRPAWTDDASGYRADMSAPDSKWSWATPEQCEEFRQMAGRMATYAENEGPLSFFAQINFAQLAGSGALKNLPELPQTGILYLFYDYFEQPWGFDPKDAPGFQLIYVESPENLVRTPIPAELSNMQAEGPFQSRYLSAHPHVIPPSWEQQIMVDLDQNDDVLVAYAEWCDDDDANVAGHRLMGWPHIIQNAMETECALVTASKYCGDSDAYNDPENAEIIKQADDWILLLQLDSDEEAGFMFGDSGILYVWIRKQDLATRAFDKAWVIVQCY